MTEIVCVQNEYNLARRADDRMIGELAKRGVAYVPYFPLGGFTPLQSSTLTEVAAAMEATPKQVALAWLLQRSPNILLIPGTSSIGHLRENLAAARLRLSPRMIETLDAVGEPPARGAVMIAMRPHSDSTWSRRCELSARRGPVGRCSVPP